MSHADIGLIGLAVMGQNLALNIHDHGFAISVYNRSAEKTQAFLSGPAEGTSIAGFDTLEALVASLERPRKILLMIRAGSPVDQTLEQLFPLLEPGDIVIDGGNSHFADSDRRTELLQQHRLHFVGCGISGGEEGARHGPSIMPGGDPQAWPHIRPILQAIAAQVDEQPCCQWVGNGGSGHYVKMVHNGIEYGDMQLIAETYALMREGLGLPLEQIQQRFAAWNRGALDSYLIEITVEILTMRDTDGAPLIDKILDTASQKGTGKWTGISALKLGIPLTLIGEAVFARCLSALKTERLSVAERFPREPAPFNGDVEAALQAIHDALYAAKIMSYVQGYRLMQEAANHYNWQLAYGDIALMWRGGCIIRSVFLGDIKRAFDKNAELSSLLVDDFFVAAIKQAETGWRKTAILGIELGIPLPAISSALAFFDGYRSATLPANIIQAQRDFFGAHMYERVDQPAGKFFHTNWTGAGGNTASGNYEV